MPLPFFVKIALVTIIFLCIVLGLLGPLIRGRREPVLVLTEPEWVSTKTEQFLTCSTSSKHSLALRRKTFFSKALTLLCISGFSKTGDKHFDQLIGVENANSAVFNYLKSQQGLRTLLMNAFLSNSNLKCIALDSGRLSLIFEGDSTMSRIGKVGLIKNLEQALNSHLSTVQDTTTPFRQSSCANILAISFPMLVAITSSAGFFFAAGFNYLEESSEPWAIAAMVGAIMLISTLVSQSYVIRLASWVLACGLTAPMLYSSFNANVAAINELTIVPHATLTARVYGVKMEFSGSKRQRKATHKLFLSDIKVVQKVGDTAPIPYQSYVLSVNNPYGKKYYKSTHILQDWKGPDKAIVKITFSSGKLGKVFISDISVIDDQRGRLTSHAP